MPKMRFFEVSEWARTSASFNAAIPDDSASGVTCRFLVSDDVRIQHVELGVDITHSWRGDLSLTLTSPDGTESTLVDRPLAGQDSTENLVFKLSTAAFWGELSQGQWTIKVSDGAPLHTGTLNSITFSAFGDANTADDRYIYTDEFASYNSGRDVLRDTSGVDTLNAAAVTTNQVIDLRPGHTSTIAGHPLVISADTVIENAFGGDGADMLIGNTFDNQLTGGRGSDILIGGGGQDTASYESAHFGVTVRLDTGRGYSGDALGDVLSGIENLRGSEQGDCLFGDRFANHLFGEGGNDVLYGFGSGDWLDGGAGTDTASYDGSPSGITACLWRGDAWGGDGANDHLISIECLTGSEYADHLEGIDGISTTLSGGAGDDFLSCGTGDDILIGGAGADFLAGGAGSDTSSYQDSPMGVTVRLWRGDAEGGDATGDRLVSIESVIGSNHDDWIEGIDGVSTKLTGGGGADHLFGGTGADTFAYDKLTDSAPGAAGRDVISGFSQASGDKIDLSAIDAIPATAAQDHFSFIGDSPFTDAGQLRAVTDGNITLVEATAAPDLDVAMEIALTGAYHLTSADFILA